MTTQPILRLGTVKNVAEFQEYLRSLHLPIPGDGDLVCGNESPPRWPLARGGIRIGNRIAVPPMEGWMERPTVILPTKRSGVGSALDAAARN
jgi:hypothetical protein